MARVKCFPGFLHQGAGEGVAEVAEAVDVALGDAGGSGGSFLLRPTCQFYRGYIGII